MAAVVKFFCPLFLCSLIVGGECQPCGEKSLKVNQTATGKLVKNKPEWNVTIYNNCICTQLGVKLSCDGFETVKDIDASILRKSGSVCLVNNGSPIYGYDQFSFTYAWSTSFTFKLLFAQVACS